MHCLLLDDLALLRKISRPSKLRYNVTKQQLVDQGLRWNLGTKAKDD
jgi:hypothetical protein